MGGPVEVRAQSDAALTRKELSTFTSLAYLTCKGFETAMVAHTSAKPVAKSDLMGETTFVGLDRWQEIDAEHWGRIVEAARSNSYAAPKPLDPKPHQTTAVADGVAHFLDGEAARGRLVMPAAPARAWSASCWPRRWTRRPSSLLSRA